jgi:ribonuclease D
MPEGVTLNLISSYLRDALQFVAMEILVARTADEINSAYERLSACEEIGCDTETSGLMAGKSRLFSVQFSDGNLSVLVPISEGVQLGALSNILTSPDIIKIFHNAKFDLRFLSASGYSVTNIFDTMIAEKVLTKGAYQSASLAETLYRYFAVDLDKAPRDKFSSRKWDGIWTEELVNYALADVIHLPQLMKEQNAWLIKLGLTERFNEKHRSALNG